MAKKNFKKVIGKMGKVVLVALKYVIGVPVGLLIFNPITIIVISIKNSWSCWFADVMEGDAPVSLAAKLMAILTFAVMLVALCITLNPITVWGIALFAPQWVAEKCYADLSEGFWPLLINIPMSWQGWIGHLLPWRCRRYFVEERFCRYSSKDRMRLTLQEPSHFFSFSDKEVQTQNR